MLQAAGVIDVPDLDTAGAGIDPHERLKGYLAEHLGGLLAQVGEEGAVAARLADARFVAELRARKSVTRFAGLCGSHNSWSWIAEGSRQLVEWFFAFELCGSLVSQSGEPGAQSCKPGRYYP